MRRWVSMRRRLLLLEGNGHAGIYWATRKEDDRDDAEMDVEDGM